MGSELPGSPGGGSPINPRVVPESPVFGGQRCLDQRLGDFAIVDRSVKRAVARAHYAQCLAVPIQEFQFRNWGCEQTGRQRHEAQSQWGGEQKQDAGEDEKSEVRRAKSEGNPKSEGRKGRHGCYDGRGQASWIVA